MNQGISYRRFITHAQNASCIAEEWPFGNMASNTAREPNLHPGVGPFTPAGDYNQGVVVDYAATLRRNPQQAILLLSPYAQPEGVTQYDFELSIAPQEVDAWNVLRGVRLAARLSINSDAHHSSRTRFGVVNRILGIEQPMRTPHSKRPACGQHDQGYIHGRITQVDGTPSERSSGNHFVRLRLGKEITLASLRRSEDTQVKPDRYSLEHNGPLYGGDIIRTRVTRDPDNPHLFHTDPNAVIHILEPSRER